MTSPGERSELPFKAVSGEVGFKVLFFGAKNVL
jgi:hypothetical protein